MIDPLTRLSFVARARATVGGDQGRVEIHLIAHPDDDQTEARRLLKEQFATFDAGKARCFLASDREHLLAVIEAGFGDFYDFNRVARNLLASRLRNPSFPLAPPSSGGLRGQMCPPEHAVELLGTFVKYFTEIHARRRILRLYAETYCSHVNRASGTLYL